MMGQKLEVKVYIVCYKYFIMKHLHDTGSYFLERRSILQHLIVNAGQTLYEDRDLLSGMNKGGESLFDPLPVTYHNRYFSDIMLGGLAPGGFNIYYGKIQIKELILNVKIRA